MRGAVSGGANGRNTAAAWRGTGTRDGRLPLPGSSAPKGMGRPGRHPPRLPPPETAKGDTHSIFGAAWYPPAIAAAAVGAPAPAAAIAVGVNDESAQVWRITPRAARSLGSRQAPIARRRTWPVAFAFPFLAVRHNWQAGASTGNPRLPPAKTKAPRRCRDPAPIPSTGARGLHARLRQLEGTVRVPLPRFLGRT